MDSLVCEQFGVLRDDLHRSHYFCCCWDGYNKGELSIHVCHGCQLDSICSDFNLYGRYQVYRKEKRNDFDFLLPKYFWIAHSFLSHLAFHYSWIYCQVLSPIDLHILLLIYQRDLWDQNKSHRNRNMQRIFPAFRYLSSNPRGLTHTNRPFPPLSGLWDMQFSRFSAHVLPTIRYKRNFAWFYWIKLTKIDLINCLIRDFTFNFNLWRVK